MTYPAKKQIYTGIAVAVLATFIWSWNFVVARGIYKQVPPVTLAFYRWLTATLVILPFAISSFKKEELLIIKPPTSSTQAAT